MDLNRMGQGFFDAVNTGPEDYRKTQHLARNLAGQEEEAPMFSSEVPVASLAPRDTGCVPRYVSSMGASSSCPARFLAKCCVLR